MTHPRIFTLSVLLGLGLQAVLLLVTVTCFGCAAGQAPKDAPGSVDSGVARYEHMQAETFFVLPEDERKRRVEEGWSKARAFVLAFAVDTKRSHLAASAVPRLDVYRTSEEVDAASGKKYTGKVHAGFTDRRLCRVGLLGYDEDTLIHEAAHWYLNTDDCELCEEAVRWARKHPNAIEEGLNGLRHR